MGLTYDGPDGVVPVGGESESFVIHDNFNRADSTDAGGTWKIAGGKWGISPSRCTEEPIGSLTARVVRAGDGRVIGPFNGWPQVVVPDEAVDGDVVTWNFRGDEVIGVRIGDPPSDYDENCC